MEGHVEILEWFENHGFELCENNMGLINLASSNENIHLSEWLKLNKYN